MLRSLSSLRGYTLAASDDDIGKIRDLLFEDRGLVVQYAVAVTGPWLFGRKVLVPWSALGAPDWHAKRFPVSMTRQEVKDLPGLETDPPVSQQQKRRAKALLASDPQVMWAWVAMVESEDDRPALEGHLRSAHEVTGYRVEAKDGPIGHVEDLIAEDGNWIVRYVVIDTRDWLPGRKVLVPATAVRGFEWGTRSASVGLTKQAIESSPEHDPAHPLGATYEVELREYWKVHL